MPRVFLDSQLLNVFFFFDILPGGANTSSNTFDQYGVHEAPSRSTARKSLS